MVKMNRFDGVLLPAKAPGENPGATGCTLAEALYGWSRITDQQVADVKKYTSIPAACRMRHDLFPRIDTRCKKMFAEMRSIGLLAPPEPDGTRSSPSSKMNSFAPNGHDVVGFVVWTKENSVWVIFY